MDKKLILRVLLKLMTAILVIAVSYVFISALSDNQGNNKTASSKRIDVSAIKPGEVKYFTAFNKKILVLYRTDVMLKQLDEADVSLLKRISADDLADNMNATYRSITPRYFVAYAYDPFYGCEIRLSDKGLSPVCIDLKYDWSGRVYKSRRAEDNLKVPRYDVESEAWIRIYVD